MGFDKIPNKIARADIEHGGDMVAKFSVTEANQDVRIYDTPKGLIYRSDDDSGTDYYGYMSNSEALNRVKSKLHQGYDIVIEFMHIN